MQYRNGVSPSNSWMVVRGRSRKKSSISIAETLSTTSTPEYSTRSSKLCQPRVCLTYVMSSRMLPPLSPLWRYEQNTCEPRHGSQHVLGELFTKEIINNLESFVQEVFWKGVGPCYNYRTGWIQPSSRWCSESLWWWFPLEIYNNSYGSTNWDVERKHSITGSKRAAVLHQPTQDNVKQDAGNSEITGSSTTN